MDEAKSIVTEFEQRVEEKLEKRVLQSKLPNEDVQSSRSRGPGSQKSRVAEIQGHRGPGSQKFGVAEVQDHRSSG